jgi:LysM repeat protein
MGVRSQTWTKPTSESSFTPTRIRFLQRRCACGGTPGPDGECAECREKRLQRRFTGLVGPVTAPAVVHEVLRSPGQSLDPATRTFMEPRFDHDFSQVRVHRDAKATESARAVNALAYTVGRDVVFGAGQYAPRTRAGQRLLAHELTHVMQQANSSTPQQYSTFPNSDHLEQEASASAEGILTNSLLPPLSSSITMVQRQVAGRDAGVDAGSLDAGVTRTADAGEASTTEYVVVKGDTLGKIARQFGTTTEALMRLNGLKATTIQIGQRLRVPASAGCGVVVPTDADTQLLAGVIFAEASPTASDQAEREAIGWSFVNSVQHTKQLCAGIICPTLKPRQRKDQCTRDRRDLGETLPEAVRIGSLAVGGSRWNMVMSGNTMLPAATLCGLVSSERTALTRAITAAQAVNGGTATAPSYLRFNRAKDSPPSPRMELAGNHEGHTFYRFKPDRTCG